MTFSSLINGTLPHHNKNRGTGPVNRIVVQAPGESDPQRLRDVIGQTAKLTFQMVDETVTPEDLAAGRIPPGSQVYPADDGFSQSYVLKKRALVTGEMLTDAQQQFDQQSGQPVVLLGSGKEAAMAQGIADEAGAGVQVLAGRTTLDEAMALVAGIELSQAYIHLGRRGEPQYPAQIGTGFATVRITAGLPGNI